MEKREQITDQIKKLAELLEPLTVEISGSSLVWNGTEYAESKSRHSNPSASRWQQTLVVIANLLEAQKCEISRTQLNYLRSTLFGGMGSLSDAVGIEMLESEEVLVQFREILLELYHILR